MEDTTTSSTKRQSIGLALLLLVRLQEVADNIILVNETSASCQMGPSRTVEVVLPQSIPHVVDGLWLSRVQRQLVLRIAGFIVV